MSNRRYALLAAIILSAPAAGCRDSLGPDDVAGTYVLHHVVNDPLPAVISRDSRATVHVIADTLRLEVNGKGTFASVHVTTEFVNPPVTRDPIRIETPVTFRVVGSRIEMTFVCPINANCTAGPHRVGRRHGDLLLVTETYADPAAYYYRRVSRNP